MKLACLLLSGLPCAVAWGASVGGPRPKATADVGIVCARLGTYVVVALAKGAAVQPGQEFTVGRPTLLVAVVNGEKSKDYWGNWQEAGRIKIRALRAARFCIALVTKDNVLTGLGGEPAPNIRPGDIVVRPAAATPPAP